MRLSMLTAIAVSLFAVSTAGAQSDQNDMPYPTATSEATRPSGPAMPAWQALPGGYGGWHGGGYADCGHDSCCGSCDSCCGSCCRTCRPGLIYRLRSLKCRICSRLACRRACRSCCGSCCGDCGHAVPEGMPTPPSQGDLLPVPPAEAAPYSDDADDSMPEQPQSPHRPTSARSKVKHERYSMPRVTSASKTTKSRKQR